MFRLALLVFGLCFYFLPASTQTFSCVHQMDASDFTHLDRAAFERYRQERVTRRSTEKVKMGITIHIVQTNDGAANIEIQKLYEELDAVNRFFASAGMEFYFCGAPRFIQGRSIYTYSQAALDLNRSNAVEQTINIYYLDEIGDQQFSQFACGISQFPWRGPLRDRFIIMQKGCSTNGAVLAHELGHFFGLFHTHESFRGLELVNGSNCEEAGDLLCDTPADPNLGVYGLDGCVYVSDVRDPNGAVYSPDPGNIMSYSPSRCQSRFSEEQRDLMNFYLETTDLNTLLPDCDFYPDYAIDSDQGAMRITSGQVLNLDFTFDNQGIREDQAVELFWLLEQDGEVTRIIRKDTLQLAAGTETINRTFDVEFPIFRGTGEYTLTAVLDPDSKIQERDKRNNFFEIELVVDNSQFENAVLFPNPAQDRLKIFVRDRGRGGDIYLQVVDYLGRIYSETKRFKSGDEFFAEVDISHLTEGLYILNVWYDRDDVSQPFIFVKE